MDKVVKYLMCIYIVMMDIQIHCEIFHPSRDIYFIYYICLSSTFLVNFNYVIVLSTAVTTTCYSLGTSILVSIVAPIYNPTSSAQGLPFLHSSPTCFMSCLFDTSYSNRCKVIFHCGSDLHFPND